MGGAVSLAGWAADVPALTDWGAIGISIQPNTALAALCAGAALMLLTRGYHRLAVVLGALVAAIGGLTLFEILSGANLGIDTLLLFDRTWGRTGVLSPGRMGPPGSVSWTILGFALVLASWPGDPRAPRRAIVPALALVTTAIPGLSLIGHLYSANLLYTVPTVSVIALQTSTFIFTVSLGLTMSVREYGPMRLFAENSPAGVLIRRVLPAVIVIPIVVGYFRLAGEQAGLYDLASGSAARTVVEIGFLLALLWWTAKSIDWQTQRRAEAEQKIEASEHRLRTLFESVAVSLWEEDFSDVLTAIENLKARGVTDFRRYFQDHPEFVHRALRMVNVLGVNDATVAMFQASDKDALIGALPRIYGPDSTHVFIEELVAVAEGRTYLEAEAVLTTLRGAPVYVFFTMSVPRSSTRYDRVLLSVFDLTERREAERKLVEHERLLRTVTEQARVGLIIISPEHRYLYANRAYCEAVGYASHEIVGLHIAQVLPDIYVEQIRPRLMRAFSGEHVRYELALPVRNRFMAVTYQPQFDGAAVKSVIGALVDMTERRRAETALEEGRRQLEADLADSQLLQRMSAEIIHENDVEALYDKILESAARVMRSQYASMQILEPEREPGAGKRLRLLAHRGFSAEAVEHWQWVDAASHSTCGIALRTGERVVVSDVETSPAMLGTADAALYRRNGIRAVQSTPLISRSGGMLGMISTHWTLPCEPSDRDLRLLDILARQAADLIERRLSEESLRDADRRKNEFLATLAHELRNPLAPIRNAVDLLKRKGPFDPELLWIRDVIDRQVTLMARLLDDLLDLGRISRNRLELRRQRVDLASVIHGAAEMCEPLVEGFNHQLHVALPPQPIYLDADPARLGQVFGNLLNNACRYTEPNGQVSIVCERRDGEAVITVRDTGIGIPRDQLASIFEMFSQVDHSLERSQGGLGIGLHLVKQLVDMHGGSIEAHSDGPGTGSEFVVRLPVLGEPAGIDAPSMAPAGALAGQPRRVLVVDDNADAASSLVILLELTGHETCAVHDGVAAVETAGTFRPHVILLDIGLPKLNGFDACRRIREQPWGKDIVIVALTGWGQDIDRRHSESAGFDHHMVKPVEHATLMSVLTSLLLERGSQLTN